MKAIILVFIWLGYAAAAKGDGPVHWAFAPVRKVEPTGEGLHGSANPIDRFVARRLHKEGLRPVERASRLTLVRRVYFDLIGLPPSPRELNEFLADGSPDAWENLIERLLASPQYGERWGRHWMDVVRYADTAGDNADYPIPEAYRYRDYIIDAFNRDKPYDEFVREQLAGDILASESKDGRYSEKLVATGFLALSRRYATAPYELWHLTLENTIETVGQAFIGLNLRCARCHNHKYDPVSVEDYYGLYGILESTEFPWPGGEELQSKNFNRQKFVPLVPPSEAEPKLKTWREKVEGLRADLEALEKDKDESRKKEREQKIARLKKELRRLERRGLPPDMPAALAVQEGKARDAFLQVRGEPDKKGPVVPRHSPKCLSENPDLQIPEGASGRLEFARWLTRPDHPLTARVMVNRVWQHHFGKGLVGTPNNFGTRGELPTHPELLDYLAARFVESGWSVKAIHRLILSSETYRLSSVDDPANLEKDPSNNSYWHFGRRRLEAEAIRDAIMFSSGGLDLARAGEHPFPAAEEWNWTQHNPFKNIYSTSHRGVYLMTPRFQRHPFLALFDGPDTNTSTESRRASIVPQQALFALNNPFMDQQARLFARRVLAEGSDEAARLRYAHELALGRAPSSAEADKWKIWLAVARAIAGETAANQSEGQREEEAWTSAARVLLSSNEFLYVE